MSFNNAVCFCCETDFSFASNSSGFACANENETQEKITNAMIRKRRMIETPEMMF
jgi:hypothetical protein